MARGDDAARDPGGRYAMEPDTPARYAEALRLRARGLSYRAIAAEMGWSDGKSAYEAVRRALEVTVAEPAAEVRAIELAKLDAAEVAVNEVLEREHVTVSQGHVVRQWRVDANGDPIVAGHDDNGKPYYQEEPILDDAPVLAAVDRLIKIAQRRAALLGLDSPVKQEVAASVTYEVVGVPTDQLGGEA